MAKVSARGATLLKQHEVLAQGQVDPVRYALRSDNKILYKYRILGKWESWKIWSTTAYTYEQLMGRMAERGAVVTEMCVSK